MIFFRGSRVLLTAVVWLAIVTTQCVAASGCFAWVDTEEGVTELRRGDRPVLSYMHLPYDDSSPQRREATYKPYHHVWSPDGENLLTKGPGGLYPHHRGLFYGFREVTYGGGKTCDIWHCTRQTHQEHVRTLCQCATASSACHSVLISWHGREGEVFANERRTVSVAARPGGLVIDFVSRLESADGMPIHLDGDPQHAGFHFRAAQEVADDTAGQTYYLRTDGPGAPGETRNWEAGGDEATNAECSNRPWNAMSFVTGGQRYTVLYLYHPENPRPARYSERDYGRFGSYFVADVAADQPLVVRYRLWIQEGEMTVGECEAMYERYAGHPRAGERTVASRGATTSGRARSSFAAETVLRAPGLRSRARRHADRSGWKVLHKL